MKNLYRLCIAITILGCDNNAKEAPKEEFTETAIPESVMIEATGSNPASVLFVWKSSPDFTKEYNNQFKPEILHVDSLIKGLNEMNEKILLQKVKISGDTIYTEIKDSRYLGNEMGSTGAEIYIADLVLNLTEVPGIKYVQLQLTEGSHVQPGTWSKKDFAKYKPTK